MGDWVQFRALKEAVSLEAVLHHYQVPGLRRRRSQLEGCCPIHRGQRDDSFRASLTKNVFHCFACQAQGNVLDFVSAMGELLDSRGSVQATGMVWGSRVSHTGGLSGRRAEERTGSGKRRVQSAAAFRLDGGGSFPSLPAATGR